jgi:hypothetical protein
MQMTTIDEGSKHIIDLLSVTTVLGTLMGILPSIAAVFTIVWTAIRIYETKTVKELLGKIKENNNASL